MTSDVLDVRDLKVQFHINETVVKAVDGVSFRVPAGKTVAIVGESGSGKSVISQAIMGIIPKPGAIAGGEIHFHDPRAGSSTDVDIARLGQDSAEMRSLRGG